MSRSVLLLHSSRTPGPFTVNVTSMEGVHFTPKTIDAFAGEWTLVGVMP
jgi:hypothetical protein